MLGLLNIKYEWLIWHNRVPWNSYTVLGYLWTVTSFIHPNPGIIFISNCLHGQMCFGLISNFCLFQQQDWMSTSNTTKSWHMTMRMCTEVTFEHGVLWHETMLSICGSVPMAVHLIFGSRGTYPHSAITWLWLDQLVRWRMLRHHTFIMVT
jgi:hypothetical protein